MTTPQAILIAFAMLLPATIQAQTSTKQIAARLSTPVFATAALGDQDRLFFIEQGSGNVRVLDLATEQVLADPYLTVGNLDTGSEKGLLGLAFHPDFETNGKLFVYASQNGGSQDHRSQVFEYTAEDPMNSNTVDASTQRSVLRFDQPFANHNGGWIGFDPTAAGDARNHLYIGTGDGGSANDPQNNSQDITDNLLGKLLRIDIAGDDFPTSDVQNYSVPQSNPFVDVDGDDEILAYGLRNPWRTSFDRQTGDIWIGDVGQNRLEEIDFLPAGTSGQNFGWRVMEGNSCFNSGDARDGNLSCNDVSLTSPVYEYGRAEGPFGGTSVTGGYVYRGPLEEFQGQYFFADWGSGNIWTRDPDSGTVLNRNSELEAASGGAIQSVGSFGEDAAGNLYLVSTGFSANRGSIYRIDSASRDAVWDGSTWIRDGVSGAEFEDGDHLIVRDSQLNSSDIRRVAALTLESGTISLGARTEVISGNVTVPQDSRSSLTVVGGGSLVGTSGSIRKLGGGDLAINLAEKSNDILAVHEGTAELEGTTFARMKVSRDARLDARNVRLDDGSLNIEAGGQLLLDFVNQDGAPMESPHNVDLLNAEGEIVVTQSIDEALRMILNERDLTILSAVEVESTGSLQLEDSSDGDVLNAYEMSGVTVQPSWDLSGNRASLNLTLVRGIEGDTNLDGIVDFADFLTFASNFGETSLDWRDGAFSGGGVVQFADFLGLAENFGRTGFEPVVRAAPVPEPNGLMMLLTAIASIGFSCRSRRRP